MAGPGGTKGKIDRRQEHCIAALLSCPTIGEAAKHGGVSERSLHRWLANDVDFQARYQAARRQLISHAVARLQRSCDVAAQVLEAVAQDVNTPAAARVSAAKAILEMAIRGAELEDGLVRIAHLEASMRARDVLPSTGPEMGYAHPYTRH